MSADGQGIGICMCSFYVDRIRHLQQNSKLIRLQFTVTHVLAFDPCQYCTTIPRHDIPDKP